MRFTRYIFLTLILAATLLSGCKTEFEKIRSSTDSKLIYKKALEYYENEEYMRAQTLFELIVGSYRGQKEAEDLYFKYAYTHYYLKKYILASYYFKNFTNTFTASKHREKAEFMVANCFYKLSPNYRLDQTYSEKAIEAFQIYVNTYPNSERVPECNQLMDDLRTKMEKKAFAEAELYYNLKQYQSATRSFTNMLADFPETTNAEKIRYLMTKANYLLATNSIDDKKEERFTKTVEYYQRFVSRYPDSEYSKELEDIYTTSKNKIKEFSNDGRY